MKKLLLFSLLVLFGCSKEDNSSLIEGYETQIQNYLNQTKALQDQLLNISQTVSSLSTQVTSLQTSNSDLTSQVSSLETSNSDLSSQVSEQSEMINSLNEELSSLISSYDDLESEYSNLLANNTTLESTNSDLSNQIALLQQQIAELNSTSSETTSSETTTEETTSSETVTEETTSSETATEETTSSETTTEETTSSETVTEETTSSETVTEETTSSENQFSDYSAQIAQLNDLTTSLLVLVSSADSNSNLNDLQTSSNSYKTQLNTVETSVNTSNSLSSSEKANLIAEIVAVETDLDAIDASLNVLLNPVTYIPDDLFEQTLIDLGYDDILDDYVKTNNISNVERLTLWPTEFSNTPSASSLNDITGLEDFTNLNYLAINGQFSSLSIPATLNKLENLTIAHSANLSSLSVSSESIEWLYIKGPTSLTSVDTSNIPNLLGFYDGDVNYQSGITSLDFSSNTKIIEISIKSSEVSSLNISGTNLLNQILISQTNTMSGVLDISHIKITADVRINGTQISCLKVRQEQLDKKDEFLASVTGGSAGTVGMWRMDNDTEVSLTCN